MLDDLWVPEKVVEDKPKVRHAPKYRVTCKCGHEMRVKRKHFGRMCRCTHCKYPIYVTNDNVTPPLSAADKEGPRFYSKIEEVPVHWEEGDLFLELYQVKGVLGEGGMGTVYKVHHRGWGRNLAVKSPSAKLLDDEDWVRQFDHECETWVSLTPHPNIVQCHYVRRLGGIPRVFVEFVNGLDLGNLIFSKHIYKGGRRLVHQRMIDVAIQFAWGLQHAHDEGLIHQDVKPGNLLVSQDGTAKVTDFGLAKVWKLNPRASSGSGTSMGAASRGLSGGTPTYRSPDHINFGKISHKTDMWSWGLSMVELYSGDIFWTKGSEAMQILDNLMQFGSRYDIIPIMPKSMVDLLQHCFREDPRERPANMREIVDALKTIYKEVGGAEYPREEPHVERDQVDLLNNRAVSMLDLGKSEESEALWEEIIERDSAHLPARYNQGLHLWRIGKITDAQLVETLYRICHERPQDWQTPYLLARVFMERGECKVAIEILEKLPQNDQNKRDIMFALAMAQNYRKRDKRLVWELMPDDMKVTAVGLSFDGWRAVTGGVQGQVRIWDVQSGKCLTVMRGHEDRIHAVSLSDEETVVLSASADRTLKVWDPVSGKCLQTFEGHVAAVRSATFTPNAKNILSASEDGTVMLWDVATGKCERVFQGHRSGINVVRVSACGNYVFSGGRDNTVRQWDFWKGTCQRTFTDFDSRITSIAVSRDGSIMLVASGTMIHLYDLEDGLRKRSIRGHQTEIFSVCLDDSGRYAISATGMGTIKVWDVRAGQCLRSLKGYAPAALSRDGRYAISGGKKSEFKVWCVGLDEPPFQAQYLITRGE